MNRLAPKKTDIWVIPVILLVSVAFGYIAGFRPFGIGLDFLNYQFFYDDIRSSDKFSYFRFEPGFVYVAAMFKSFTGLDYTYFAAFLMTLSLIIKLSVLKRLDHPVLAVIFYLSAWYPLLENTQVRIAFATSLMFLATDKMIEKRWTWFLLLSAIASTFHLTAAAAATGLAAASFLARYRLRYSIPLIGLGGLALSAFITTIMLYATQLNPLLLLQDTGSNSPNIFSVLNIAIFLFLIFFVASGSAKENRRRIFFLVTCGGFMVLLVFFQIPVIAQRLKELLMVFMTFIAFEYRLNSKALPQTILATLVAGGSLYSAISYGLFSN
ncbi:EpsG family protein (plasmid) [Sulfitobacter pontiacus]|uniref:EpsG family protein n=1 Tax=Sulfitobacter pontiacus TaxID=60137 RepID=UPI002AC8B3CD|nr:EpsG family protein [Sulfitobacter pontiacus]WPZ27566.1 EpsG family protein [Sulfitobacter pontiacus]